MYTRKLKQHTGLLHLLYIKDTHLCQWLISYFNSSWNVTCPTKHNCRALKQKEKEEAKNTKIAWRHRKYGTKANVTMSAQSRRSTRCRNIFLLCRGELEAIRKKTRLSTVLLTSVKQQWRLKHRESAPATASCHFESSAWIVVCGRKPKMDKCLQEPQGNTTALQTLKIAAWIPALTTHLVERSLAPRKLQTDTKNPGSPLKSHPGPARQIPQAPWLETECWWAKARRGIQFGTKMENEFAEQKALLVLLNPLQVGNNCSDSVEHCHRGCGG